MSKVTEIQFTPVSFGDRLKSMLAVDFRRMFTTSLFYIMTGTCLVIPILILVMTTMTGGTDPATGAVASADMFTNTWQVIGSLSSENSTGAMSMTSMCNINLLYFFAAVFVCLFISDDFKSGYAKNLFTVRSKKSDYVISKILAEFVCGTMMLLAFFIGAMIGGAIAGLSFDLGVVGISGIVMCMLSKIFLMMVFIALFTLMSVIGKQNLWLSIALSLGVSMLFFMMIPMLTPLDAGMMNVILCLASGVLFCIGFGAISSIVLKKTRLV